MEEKDKDREEGKFAREYGTHSLCKGSSTYACCPSQLGVQSLYLQYEKAGDQYVGRVVSGLNVNDESFAVMYKPIVFLFCCTRIIESMTNKL